MNTNHTPGRWRFRVKEGVAALIKSVGSRHGREHQTGSGYRPLVLGYHRVVDDYETAAKSEMASMLISTAMFEKHLDRIGRHFRFVDVDQIGAAVRNGVPFDEPVAAVTFDDGYQDIYEHAMPILKRKGIPAAAFVVTDLVGRSAWQTHDKLYRLVEKGFGLWDDPRGQLHGMLDDLGLPASEIFRKRVATRTPMMVVSALLPNLSQEDVHRVMEYLEWGVGNGFINVPQTLSWPMLKEMRRNGFTIGSHTRSHVSLPMEPAEKTLAELEGSKRALEEGLGEAVDHFAYPGGQFTPAVVEALDRAGYQYAYTACTHQDPRHPALTIERLLLWEGSSVDADGQFSTTILDCQVRDLWPPARVCQRAHA